MSQSVNICSRCGRPKAPVVNQAPQPATPPLSPMALSDIAWLLRQVQEQAAPSAPNVHSLRDRRRDPLQYFPPTPFLPTETQAPPTSVLKANYRGWGDVRGSAKRGVPEPPPFLESK